MAAKKKGKKNPAFLLDSLGARPQRTGWGQKGSSYAVCRQVKQDVVDELWSRNSPWSRRADWYGKAREKGLLQGSFLCNGGLEKGLDGGWPGALVCSVVVPCLLGDIERERVHPNYRTYLLFSLDDTLGAKHFPGAARIGDLKRQSLTILLFHVLTGARATRRNTGDQ